MSLEHVFWDYYVSSDVDRQHAHIKYLSSKTCLGEISFFWLNYWLKLTFWWHWTSFANWSWLLTSYEWTRSKNVVKKYILYTLSVYLSFQSRQPIFCIIYSQVYHKTHISQIYSRNSTKYQIALNITIYLTTKFHT